MDILSEDLQTKLANSSPEELNDANFGIIKLDDTGNVMFYNRYESELAGLSPEEAQGRNFFTDVAPCTNNFMVANRYVESASDNVDLDETLDYIFTYRLKPTKVKLRLLISAQDHWLCVQKQ